METSDWGDSLLGEPLGPAVTEIPSVVAVVITSDPGERFDEALASLAAQDYPNLTVLVVDAGSRVDPSPRIGERIPDAFIRRISRRASFPEAANEALAAVEGANFLLFCADDVVLAHDAVSLLVEEAVRSNAGIVGPKFVDTDRPDVLLEIGLTADKLGVSARLVDPGEIDHEQHDAVRDVLAVPYAALLVRADLYGELEGFDPEFTAGVEELDLCWRARLVGARVLVAPDALVRRPREAIDLRFGPDPDAARALEPAQRLLMLLRNYSWWSLVRVLPQAVVVSVIQSIGLLFMGRVSRSWAVIRAWFWNLRHLRSTLADRRQVQALRAVPDQDIRALQLRGFTYVRAFLAGQLDLGNRVDTMTGAGRDLAESVTGGIRRPSIVFGAVLTALVVVGSRDLLGSGVPAVGSFLPWPDAWTSWREFTSGWRFAGVGSASPAPPAFVLMGGVTTLAFGSPEFARTLVIVGAIPLGAYGAFRMMLPLAQSVWPPLAAATAYAVVPLPRNAIAAGRLGPLVFYALAPFLITRVLRAAGIPPFAGAGDGRPERDQRRAMFSLAVLLALVGAVLPVAVLLVPLAALMLVAAVPLAGGRAAALSGLVRTLAASGIALALLFPWSVGLLLPVPDPGSLGFVFRNPPDLFEALLFDTGPASVGIAGVLLGVAAQPLLTGSGERLRWAVRAWVLAFGGWVAAWLPARSGLDLGFPAPEGPLVLAAVGVAMAVGLGSGVLREELQRTGLSWRQGVALVAVGGLFVATVPFLGDTLDGRWRLPARDWSGTLAWTSSDRVHGGFRILWIGDPDVLPLDPLPLADGTGYGLTREGPGDALGLWPAPAEGATAHVRQSLEAAIDGRVERLGHLLGPLAVRYVALPLAQNPGDILDDDELRVSPLEDALARQIDLAELVVDPGLRLYANDAWIPTGALVDGDIVDEVAGRERAESIRFDLSGARPVGGLPRGPEEIRVSDDDRDRVDGLLVVGEAYHTDWEATVAGTLRPHTRVLGLVNGFLVEDVDLVSVSYGGQWLRYGALGVQAVIWLVVIGAWSQRRAREQEAWRIYRDTLRDVRPGPARPVPEEASV